MSTYFIKNLNLAASDVTAAVSGGGLYVFEKGLSEQQKNDVCQSNLLCQLATNWRYDRTDKTNKWHRYYTITLGHIGWIIGSPTFNSASPSGSADKFVTDHFQNILGSSALEGIKSVIQKVKSLADDHKVTKIFTSGSSKGSDTYFQVAYCSQSGDNVVIDMVSFGYHAEKDVKNPLSSTLKESSAKATTTTQRLTLNSHVYDQVRSGVEHKLGSNVDDKIAKVET